MRIDSISSTFSFQGDFSFQAFLEHGKKTASKKESANGQANELSNEPTNESTDEAAGEAAREVAREQLYSQFRTGKLNSANPTDEKSESNNNPNSSNTTNYSSTFKMGGTSQALEAQKGAIGNVSAKNLVEAQMQQVQENGASNAEVTAGSRVSHGTNMSEQMKARQAGKQAENQVLAEQMARQGALVDAMSADIQVLASSGMSGSSALYIAGLRSDSRVEFEKKRTVYETAEEDFKKIEENKEEEIKDEAKEVVSGESTEENTGEEGTITTGDSSTSDSSGEITVGSGGDATITTGSGSSDATLTTGTGDSSAATTTTTATSTTTTKSGSASGSVSFKGINIRV